MTAQSRGLQDLVGLLRVLTGLTQDEMARAAGIHKSSLSRYESGKTPIERAMLTRLMAAAGLPDWLVEGALLPFLTAVRSMQQAGAHATSLDELLNLRDAKPSAASLAGIFEFLGRAGIPGSGSTARTTSAAGEVPPAVQAEPPSAHLQSPSIPWPDHEAALWRCFAELVVDLCDRSEAEAANDPAAALEIARLALGVATTAPGSPAWRHRLEGWCWAFLANALRVATDFAGAEKYTAIARRLWEEGDAPTGDPLSLWRLLDLEASLRRDRRQFGDALALLDRAISHAPRGARGRILLKRSATLELAGEYRDALRVLDQAAPLIHEVADRRQCWILELNRTILECHLGRYDQAGQRLPDLAEATATLGNRLDELRFQWVAARVACGTGRPEQARGLLEEVQQGFSQHGIANDAALVSLELAILYLEEARIPEVRALAQQMLWIFGARDIHREALAALALFCRAAEAGTVTLGLARATLARIRSPFST